MNRKLVFCIFLLMIPLLVFSVSGEVFVINSSDVRQSATIDGSFEYSYKVNYNINEGEEIYFALDRSENIILGLKYMGETETGAFIFEVHSVSNSIVRKSKRFIQQSRWAGARPFDLVRIDFADVKISVNKRLLTGNINIDTLELKRTESKGIDNFLLSTNIAKKTFSEYFSQRDSEQTEIITITFDEREAILNFLRTINVNDFIFDDQPNCVLNYDLLDSFDNVKTSFTLNGTPLNNNFSEGGQKITCERISKLPVGSYKLIIKVTDSVGASHGREINFIVANPGQNVLIISDFVRFVDSISSSISGGRINVTSNLEQGFVDEVFSKYKIEVAQGPRNQSGGFRSEVNSLSDLSNFLVTNCVGKRNVGVHFFGEYEGFILGQNIHKTFNCPGEILVSANEAARIKNLIESIRIDETIPRNVTKEVIFIPDEFYDLVDNYPIELNIELERLRSWYLRNIRTDFRSNERITSDFIVRLTEGEYKLNISYKINGIHRSFQKVERSFNVVSSDSTAIQRAVAQNIFNDFRIQLYLEANEVKVRVIPDNLIQLLNDNDMGLRISTVQGNFIADISDESSFENFKQTILRVTNNGNATRALSFQLSFYQKDSLQRDILTNNKTFDFEVNSNSLKNYVRIKFEDRTLNSIQQSLELINDERFSSLSVREYLLTYTKFNYAEIDIGGQESVGREVPIRNKMFSGDSIYFYIDGIVNPIGQEFFVTIDDGPNQGLTSMRGKFRVDSQDVVRWGSN